LSSVVECYRGRSVRVFRLERERVLRRLRERAEALVKARPDALEVRLFGSLARGQATPGSDADILVLLADGAPPLPDRLPDLARFFTGCGIGCDVLALTRSELDGMRADEARFAGEVDDGSVLALRPEPDTLDEDRR
jgi:uncharacterized protein